MPKAATKPISHADMEIRRDVIRRMKADFEVPDDRIAVAVDDGVVTVTGIVAHDAQREAAGKCARHVKGVRQVINKIEVDPAVATAE